MKTLLGWALEIVKRPKDQKGHFVVLPRRWVVERRLGWLITVAAFEQGLGGARGERGGDHPDRDDQPDGPPIGAGLSFSHRL